MACYQERYTPVVVAANSTVTIGATAVGGFLCTANGTITLVAAAADGKAQTTLINAMTVTAGTYYKLPFFLGKMGGTFTTAGGGAGVLGTS